jgi:hypothetical protein
MSLTAVETLIVDASGRQDLTTPSGRDRLITYINAAQVFLDLKTWNYKKSRAAEIISLSAGQHFVSFRYANAIDKVYISDSISTTEVDIQTYTNSELRLKKYGQEPSTIVSSTGTIAIHTNGTVTGTSTTISTDGAVTGSIMFIPNVGEGGLWLQVNVVSSNTSWTVLDKDGTAYSGGTITAGEYFYIISEGSITWGRPVFGAELLQRTAPGTSVPLPALDTIGLISKAGSEALITGLLLFPPPDTDYTLRIEGYFLTQPLDKTTNLISYWTEHAGGLPLATMTLQLLEGIQMRNSTGAKGYKEELTDFLLDTKREAIAQKSYMLGKRMRRD